MGKGLNLHLYNLKKLIKYEDLKVGAKVKIVAGPFNGMYGKVDSMDLPNQKVMLLVDLFGQETSVEVEINQIEKA